MKAMPKANAVREEPNRKEATGAAFNGKKQISESGAAEHLVIEHVESGTAKIREVACGDAVATKAKYCSARLDRKTLREGFELGALTQGRSEIAEASAANHGGGEGDECGSPEHGGGQWVASRAAQHYGDIENGGQPVRMPTALFLHDGDADCALVDLLRERPEHPRCATLFQQIM